MLQVLESNFGTCTIWINDGTDVPPPNPENYWYFRSNHGIGMISKENHYTLKMAGSAAATFLCLHYDEVTFFEFIESIKAGLN